MEHELTLCVVCLEAAAHCGCSQEARGAMMLGIEAREAIMIRISREHEAAAQQQQTQQHEQHRQQQSQLSRQTQPS